MARIAGCLWADIWVWLSAFVHHLSGLALEFRAQFW